MKQRIHQVATDLHKSNREVLAVLEKLGFKGKLHHSSTVDDEWIARIRMELEPGAKLQEKLRAKAAAEALPKQEPTPAPKKKAPVHKPKSEQIGRAHV